jgi:hypothetical protein
MTVYQGTSFTPELTRTGYAVFRVGVKVSAETVNDLAASLLRRHERQGTRWRLLSPVAQAVLVIAFLRTNLTYAELAAGSGTSPATCWRGIREGISVLADRGRSISLADVARLAVKMGWEYVIVDGVHVPVVTFGRKTGGQKAFYSGKHKRHGAERADGVLPGRGTAVGRGSAAGRDGGCHRSAQGGYRGNAGLGDRGARGPGYLGWTSR